MIDKKKKRQRRAAKTRAKIRSLKEVRLSVYRSAKHIYAQVIEPSGQVIAAASSCEKQFSAQKEYTGNVKSAALVGKLIAQRAAAKGVTKVAFDRGGYKYHGRITALADGARADGLEF